MITRPDAGITRVICGRSWCSNFGTVFSPIGAPRNESDFFGHASLLIETHGLRILSDPWWKGPCLGAQWWLYPEPCVDPVQAGPIDYIYISHGHHDHFHPATLRTLPRTSRVLVSKQPAGPVPRHLRTRFSGRGVLGR